MSSQSISKKAFEHGCNSDEETTSLTSASSSSEVQVTDRRNRRTKGANGNPGTKNRRKKKLSKVKSTKPHDAPMQKRDMYFALDCEMVGVGPEGLDSALARLSIINWDKELVLDTYVKVKEEVTDYRTFVSGVRRENIESDSAMSLQEVKLAASKILRGKILIGHGLQNDLKVIGINHPWCDIRDTATYNPYMRLTSVTKGEPPVLRPRKLRDLAWETLGSQIQVLGNAHSPIEDATATMDLYKAAREHWEVYMMKQVHNASNTMNCQEKVERPSVIGRFRKVAVEPNASFYPPTCHEQFQQVERHCQMSSVPPPPPPPPPPPRQQQQNFEQFIPKPQPIGGTYIANWTPSRQERLAAARIAQQQARVRAAAALQYQNMMQFNGVSQPALQYS